MHIAINRSIIVGLATAIISTSPVSAEGRVRPVVAPTGPVKPVTTPRLKQLSAEELQARAKPAPRYLSASELKGQIPPSIAASSLPDLKAAFTLTPAVQSVSGRGSMNIAGQIILPDNPPPGFPGQAIIRRSVSGGFGAVSFTGGVLINLNTKKDTYYILDCLAAMRVVNGDVNYTINQSPDATPSAIKISNGRFILTVPKQPQDGTSRIVFYPEFYSSEKKGPEMDFWGCQISASS